MTFTKSKYYRIFAENITIRDKKHKMSAVKEIYKFEKHLNCKIDIHRKEIAVLNNKVLNKQFKQAIFISKLYTSLYNNQTIKNLYRKFNIRKNN